MKNLIFIMLLTLITQSQALADSSCEKYLDDCQYYSCIEETKHCGKKGYLLDFGNKYCHKFVSKAEKLSLQGQLWMTEVKTCLIHQLDNLDSGLSCRKYKKAAVDQHVPCYIDSGYCQLSTHDKKAIINIIRGSLWKPSLFNAGIQVLRHCARWD